MQNSFLTKVLICVIIGLCIGGSTISGVSRTIEKTRYIYGNDSSSEITQRYTPPVACFQWHPDQPEVNETVTFDASCSEGDITDFSWSYSCGAHFPIPFGTGKLITTSFNGPCSDGAYLISLTVNGPGGSDSISHYVTVVTNKNNPPNTPTITGDAKGKTGKQYSYSLISTDPEGNNVYYYIDWGDANSTGWVGPSFSGETTIVPHTWTVEGSYTIQAKAKDTHGAESDWAGLIVTMPHSYNKLMPQFLELFFQRFPNAFPLLQ